MKYIILCYIIVIIILFFLFSKKTYCDYLQNYFHRAFNLQTKYIFSLLDTPSDKQILNSLYRNAEHIGNGTKHIIGIKDGKQLGVYLKDFIQELDIYLLTLENVDLIKLREMTDIISKFLAEKLSLDVKDNSSIHRKFYSIYRVYIDSILNRDKDESYNLSKEMSKLYSSFLCRLN